MFFQKSREKEANGARSWRQILSKYLVEKATCCKGEQQGLIITKVTCLVLRAKVKKPVGREICYSLKNDDLHGGVPE